MKIKWQRNGSERNVLKVVPINIEGGVMIFFDTGLTSLSFVVPREQAMEFAHGITSALARESA